MFIYKTTNQKSEKLTGPTLCNSVVIFKVTFELRSSLILNQLMSKTTKEKPTTYLEKILPDIETYINKISLLTKA